MGAPGGLRGTRLLSRRAATVALALLVVVHATVAWYPFRLDAPGYVAVQVDRVGAQELAFSGRRVQAEGRPPWAGVDLAGIETVTVDLEVRPEEQMQFGPARILTVSDGYTDANLMIGQERDNLVVRVRRPGSDAAGSPPLVVPRAFAGGGWRRIQVVAGRHGIAAEVEGVGQHELPVDGPPMATWDPEYPVLLGDERTGARVWHGGIRRALVTADGRSIDYVLPGRLEVADRVWYVPSSLREPLVPRDTRAQLRSLLHLLAFVPFGALLLLAWRRAGLVAIGATAAAFATALQVGKIVLAGRHPSALTVVTQTLGALAGAGLVLLLCRRDRAGREEPARPSAEGSTDGYTPRSAAGGTDPR